MVPWVVLEKGLLIFEFVIEVLKFICNLHCYTVQTSTLVRHTAATKTFLDL